ncbi:hypothetical protein F4824DRAFT_505405 [Ustulina deusta]|nr:hypothetical protein F4824DRAFT_505405 [Ustulina deusta]
MVKENDVIAIIIILLFIVLAAIAFGIYRLVHVARHQGSLTSEILPIAGSITGARPCLHDELLLFYQASQTVYGIAIRAFWLDGPSLTLSLILKTRGDYAPVARCFCHVREQ